jgi:hypothetical protein
MAQYFRLRTALGHLALGIREGAQSIHLLVETTLLGIPFCRGNPQTLFELSLHPRGGLLKGLVELTPEFG